MAWPTSVEQMEREVDNQVAAPAETRTPNLHRASKSLIEECGWKGGDSGDSAGEKPCPTKKQKNSLDSDRPSHGRPLHVLTGSMSAMAILVTDYKTAEKQGQNAVPIF